MYFIRAPCCWSLYPIHHRPSPTNTLPMLYCYRLYAHLRFVRRFLPIVSLVSRVPIDGRTPCRVLIRSSLRREEASSSKLPVRSARPLPRIVASPSTMVLMLLILERSQLPVKGCCGSWDYPRV